MLGDKMPFASILSYVEFGQNRYLDQGNAFCSFSDQERLCDKATSTLCKVRGGPHIAESRHSDSATENIGEHTHLLQALSLVYIMLSAITDVTPPRVQWHELF